MEWPVASPPSRTDDVPSPRIFIPHAPSPFVERRAKPTAWMSIIYCETVQSAP